MRIEPFSFRWRNFRAFSDTGPIGIRPVTVIIGANNSGKTSLLAPLLLLKQTARSSGTIPALITRGDLIKAGSYEDVVFQHRTELPMSLAVDYHSHSPEEEEIEEVGKYPPGSAAFTFRAGADPALIDLERYEVFDIWHRPYLVRNRRTDAKFSLERLPKGPSEESSNGQRKRSKFSRAASSAILKSVPDHFLFTSRRVLMEALSASKAPTEIEFSARSSLYLRIVDDVAASITRLLSHLYYVGPLREHPRRLYEVSGEMPSEVGTRGEYAPEILFRRFAGSGIDKINEWLRRFSFAERVLPKESSPGAFELHVRRSARAPLINYADTGFGMSQLLPLIVQGTYAPENSYIIAEQPEIHLNPRLQGLLADLFVDMARVGRGVIVETHSEHLLLRLRRLVAEGQIGADDVALYYVEGEGDGSTVREVPIKKNGHIEDRDWPRGFFEDALADSLALATSQLGRPTKPPSVQNARRHRH